MLYPLHRLKRWLISGFVITIPLMITLIILIVVFDFIIGMLGPVIAGVGFLWPNEPSTIFVQLTTLLLLVVLFVLIGFVADQTPGDRLVLFVDDAIETIPGVGGVYLTLRQVSKQMSADDTQQFEDVKLIEFPLQGAYALGFLTGDTPEIIENSAGAGEMMTIMVPLGPNPTSNGFIMHIPVDNVYDIDYSVDEAIQSVATLGVAEPE
ncbi:DUF502 domain-containing protein [Haloarchaeobius litoreus]|uniref:DUF502 domain-containing protein n=1 Tax=Haloarchaeobius litoreus TaxID=755306 RepID=A0ABD6DRE3_9EURY|nr:DUF502 domain-containing protein [Haloarchaeobius litoreus]